MLDSIVHRLLVKKGADWTNAILSEYLGLYDDSSGTFSLVWDKSSRQLVAHGSVFQSKTHAGAGLVAHIRTDDAFRGLGLGTLVTEEVTQAAFQQGAQVVVLGTDDKRYRIQQGEKAAYSMYSKLGYAILAEKELTDTVEWLMVVDRPLFERCQQEKQAAGGRFPETTPPDVREMQQALVESVREQFSRNDWPTAKTSPVGQGDMANLFLLMNLCPPDDFQRQAGPLGSPAWAGDGAMLPGQRASGAWPIATGWKTPRWPCAIGTGRSWRSVRPSECFRSPETRCRSTSTACRDFSPPTGRPWSRWSRPCWRASSNRTERPSPCRLLFSGVDEEKIRLFEELGFAPTGNTYPYFTAEGKPAFQAREWEKVLLVAIAAIHAAIGDIAVKQNRLWFLYAMITVVAWGVGERTSTTPRSRTPPFPGNAGLCGLGIRHDSAGVWSPFGSSVGSWSMTPSRSSTAASVGFLGAGGQLILFKTLRLAPAYLVFPFVALSPVVTIVMALVISKERATMKGWIGIALAVVAGVLLAYAPPEGRAARGFLWVFLALLVLLAWGIQGFAISHANKSMKAESIFFYMMLTSVLLIPVALA